MNDPHPTETTTEALLRQMSLQLPSAELDSRIEQSLRQRSGLQVNRAPSAGREIRSETPWILLATVAMVCLALGALIGRNTSSAAIATESTPRRGGDQNLRPNDGRNSSPEGTDNQNDDGTVVVDAANDGDFAFREGFAAPTVAMSCAASGRPVPGSKEEQCLICHDGLTAARDRFRQQHQSSPRFATCMWCHDTTSRTNEGHGHEPPLERLW